MACCNRHNNIFGNCCNRDRIILYPTNAPTSRGPQGPIGLTGATGPQGPQGPIGLTGATGPQGPQGPIGLTGATGPQGPQGPIGLTGATGPQGPQGPIGLTGATGPQGPQGPAGVVELFAGEFYGTGLTGTTAVFSDFNLYPTIQTAISYDTTTGTITLAEGTYLVTYGTNYFQSGSAIPSVALSVNGTIDPRTQANGTVNTEGSIAKSVLLNVSNSTDFNVVLDQSDGLTYNDFLLNVVKLN